jgi:hypothetical protein
MMFVYYIWKKIFVMIVPPSRILLCSFLFISAISLQAQNKATTNYGPVTAFTKSRIKPKTPLGKTRLIVHEKAFLKKGDWLAAKVKSQVKPAHIDLYDRVQNAYIKTADDSSRHDEWVYKYQTELYFQAPREDTFDIVISIKKKIEPEDFDEGTVWSPGDTTALDYTVGILNSSWQPSDTNWTFQQQLSYLCNHWTAGFNLVHKTFDEDKAKQKGKVTEYFPDLPITIDKRLSPSIQVMDRGQSLVYFMHSQFDTYAKAKQLFDELSAKLKGATDRVNVYDLSKMSRLYEMANSQFSIKIPDTKAPCDYAMIGSAGSGYSYLPVNMVLYGNKQQARVIVTLGAGDSSIFGLEK